MKQFVKLPKLSKGDRVAILSPSAGLPGIFPWVQDLGIERLKDEFGLVPVEYPSTRVMGASLKDRAEDVMKAFADPSIKAVFTSIGGEDQIKLLKLLDPKVLIANPKPFFGFSDNTHLHIYLWNLGIPSYYGGAIMTQFAFGESMQQMTIDSLKHSLFEEGEFEIDVASEYNDIGLDWSDQANLKKGRLFEPNDGLHWDGDSDVEGRLWGGCVESLIVQSTTARYLPKDEDLEGTILYFETAEDMPEAWIIEYLLIGFGERGWFDKFKAVLVGRPKAWDFGKPNNSQQKATYRQQQRETILKTIREYNKTIPVVQNLDFGHTDPQLILPSGNMARLSSSDKKIYLTY